MTVPGVVFLITVPTENYENIQKIVVIETEKENRVLKSRQNNYNFESNARKLSSRSDVFISENFITIEEENIDPFNNVDDQSMEKILRAILDKFKISSYSWTKTENGKFIHAVFSLKTGEFCECLLDQLRINNIGSLYESSVSVTPCSLYYSQDNDEKSGCRNADKNNLKWEGRGTWGKFVQSVRARLTIGQVIESVKADALLTFDFVFLVIMSTTMCAIGLVENSNIIMLSSMLISPMMGPVMAVTFGTVIRDMELKKVGAITEAVGLGIATIVGFLYGSVISFFYDKYGDSDWPTSEMISIGELRALAVGCLIALLSGATIAVGVLSHNVASLVGVAISTSLMPPAVNAGLLWSMTCMYYIKSPSNARYATLSFTDFYSDNRAVELSCLGAVSLCLTFVNIICIYASSILVFKIKEVAPIASKDSTRRLFWEHVKLTRNYNRLQNEPSANVTANLPTLSSALSETQKLRFADFLHHSTDLSRDPVRINIGNAQYTWSPCMHEHRPSIKQFKDTYMRCIKEKNRAKTNNVPQTVHPIHEDNPEKIAEKKFTVTPCSIDLLIQL